PIQPVVACSSSTPARSSAAAGWLPKAGGSSPSSGSGQRSTRRGSAPTPVSRASTSKACTTGETLGQRNDQALHAAGDGRRLDGAGEDRRLESGGDCRRRGLGPAGRDPT